MMNSILKKIFSRISKEQKLSFICTFIIGIIVHLFMLSNKIPNHDDLGQLYDAMNRYKHGRWFLFFPSQISSDLSLPWFNGVLGIIYISFCAMIIVWLFQMKSSICIMAVGTIMVTFPTVASTFNYMQAGDAYFFCLLLACTAVYFAIKSSKLCWGVSAILLTLSLGIYQSYLPFAVALLIVWHIKELLIEDKDVKKVFLSGIKCICIIGISIAAYLITTKIVLKYHNAEIIGHIAGFILDDISIKNMLKLILESYKNSLGFYLINQFGVHYRYLNYLYIAAVLFAILFSLYLFKQYNQRKEKQKVLLLIFLYAVLPLASGLIYCMCAQVHMLMVYGFVALALFLLILTDWIEKCNIVKKGIKGKLIPLGQILIVLTIFITSFNYAVVSNKAYLSLYLTYEQSYAYANRLMAEIQLVDDFDKDDRIVLIGYPNLNLEYTMPWRVETDVQSLRGVTLSLTNQYTFDRFLKYYLGVEQEVLRVTSLEELKSFDINPDIDALDYYPSVGSIVRKGNTIFVKFSDL